MATATMTTTRTKASRSTSRSKHDPARRLSASAASGLGGLDDPVGNVKSLYAPAARAFVRRDVALTQTLVDAAFVTLRKYPPLMSTLHEPFANLRRKWDLLRITLETTVYASSSSATASSSSKEETLAVESLPKNLRELLDLQPADLVESLLDRSEELHTPDGYEASVLYLPVSITSALVFAALKVDCVEVARNLIESWLAHRSEAASSPIPPAPHLVDLSLEPYEKILDIYCLQVLPRLGEWEYAMEFLKYEPELPIDKRKHLYTSLKTLHTQVMNPPAPVVRVSRSSSSSPSRPAANGDLHANGNGAISPASSGSASTATTPKPGSLPPSSYPSSSSSQHANGLPVPSRAGSALSTSSFSSQSSQQTIKASQQPVPRALTGNGNGNGQGSKLRASTTRSRSRSPRQSQRDVSLDGEEEEDARTTKATGPNSLTRAHSHPRSLKAPSEILPSSSVSSPHPHSAAPIHARVSILDALREWYSTSLLGSRPSTGRRVVVPTVIILVSVVLPLLAFVARLRFRRRARAVGSSPTARGKLPSARSLAMSRRAQGGGSAGAVRWVWEAVRDGVVMAGKGLV